MTAIARGHTRTPAPRKLRWRTPPALFANLDAVYGFGLDAAAEEGAGLCLAHITPEMDTLVTPWASMCQRNADGERVAFANFPSGPAYSRCEPGCTAKACLKRGWHHEDTFAGTRAFTDRAIAEARTLDGVVLLLPTAPDTRWWRACFAEAAVVRLLPRVSFVDPDTGLIGEAPPGAGYTVFTLWPSARIRHVVLCDEVGNVVHGGMR